MWCDVVPAPTCTPCTLNSRTHTDTKWGPWAPRWAPVCVCVGCVFLHKYTHTSISFLSVCIVWHHITHTHFLCFSWTALWDWLTGLLANWWTDWNRWNYTAVSTSSWWGTMVGHTHTHARTHTHTHPPQHRHLLTYLTSVFFLCYVNPVLHFYI